MFEWYKNILCVTAAGLIDECIVSEQNYKQLIHRGWFKVARRGCYGTPALVEYESMPTRFKDQIIARFGDPRKIAKNHSFKASLLKDPKALEFYRDYRLPDGRYLDPEKVDEYTWNASILKHLHEVNNDSKALRKALGNARSIWGSWAEVVAGLKSDFRHSLPTSSKRLRIKMEDFVKYGCGVLISGNYMNQNSIKVETVEQESLLKELLADPRNLDCAQVQMLYNIIAEKMEWEKLSVSAIKNWKDKLDLEITPGRRGATEYRNSRAMQIKRSRPTKPLYYLTMDGWDVELLYQDTKEDKQGRMVTTYHNRLTVVVVLDPCLNYPLGYAIGYNESPTLIREALKNAVNHTAELFGSRHMAHQLQSDRYAIKNLKDAYGVMGDKFTPAQAHNAKAKVIEPYFKRLNKKYCQLMPNWSGFGVTAKKENQPNVEYLNKYKKNFPDMEGCKSQIAGIIELERKQLVERYKELWEKVEEVDRLPLNEVNYLLQFGSETGDKNMLIGSGLYVTIEGVKQQYDCFDQKFREFASTRWTIKYDKADLSRVLAVNDDQTQRFILENKYLQPMALKERKEGDSEELNKIRSFNQLLENTITERRAISGNHVRELFEANPQLDGTLSKLVISNSLGQHKDERNSARIGDRQLKQTAKKTKELHDAMFVPLAKNEEFNEMDIYSKY